ncbi:hypothetical protein P9112_010780 [Eukaryota sp. TZLM1-RC]
MADNISLEDVAVTPNVHSPAMYKVDHDRRWETDDTQGTEQISSSIETSLFGLLYAMVKQNSVHKVASLIGLVVDFFLINTFAFSSSFNWGQYVVRPIRWFWDTFRILSWTWGGPLYITSFVVIILILIVILIDSFYVARVFRKGKFTVIWPISLLRTLIALSVTILYIPFLTILTTMVDCNIINNIFGTNSCFTYPHLIGAITAFVAIPVFILIAVLMTLVYFDPNPLSTSPLARPHSRIDCVYCLYRTVLVLVTVLGAEHLYLRSILHFFITFTMSFFIIIYQPYFSAKMNKIRSGLFGVATVSALCSILSVVYDFGEFLPFIWMGLVPFGFVIPKKLSGMRYKKLVFLDYGDLDADSKLQLFNQSPSITNQSEPSQSKTYSVKIKDHVSFSSVTDVEVSTRFLRSHANQTTLLIANHLYQAALDKFPNSSYLHVAYSIFLLNYASDAKKAALHLNSARKLGPFFDVRFTIFCQDKTQEQISKSANITQGKSLTLMNFVEFQKNYTAARKYDQLTRLLMQRFWSNLLSSTVKLAVLSPAIDEIDRAANKAKQAYEALVEKFSHSVDLLKSFASFLEEVLGEKDRASEYRKRAMREMKKKKRRAKKRRKLLEDQGPSGLEEENEEEDAMQIIEHDRANQNYEHSEDAVGTVGSIELKTSSVSLRGKPLVNILATRVNLVFMLLITISVFVAIVDVGIYNQQRSLIEQFSELSARTVGVAGLNYELTQSNDQSDSDDFLENLGNLNLLVASRFSSGTSNWSFYNYLSSFIHSVFASLDDISHEFSAEFPLLSVKFNNRDQSSSPSKILVTYSRLLSAVSSSISRLKQLIQSNAIDNQSDSINQFNDSTIDDSATSIYKSTINTLSASVSETISFLSLISTQISHRIVFVALFYFISIFLLIYILFGPLRFVITRIQYNRNVALNLLLKIPKPVVHHILSTKFVDEDQRGIPNEPPSISMDFSQNNYSEGLSESHSTVLNSYNDPTSSTGMMTSSPRNQSPSNTSSRSHRGSKSEVSLDVSGRSSNSDRSDPRKPSINKNSSSNLTPYNVMSTASLGSKRNLHSKSSKLFKVIRNRYSDWISDSRFFYYLSFLIGVVLITLVFFSFPFVVDCANFVANYNQFARFKLSIYNNTISRTENLSQLSKRFVLSNHETDLHSYLSVATTFPRLDQNPAIFDLLPRHHHVIRSFIQREHLFEQWTSSLVKSTATTPINQFKMLTWHSIDDVISGSDDLLTASHLKAHSHLLNQSEVVFGSQHLNEVAQNSLTSQDFSSLKSSLNFIGNRLLLSLNQRFVPELNLNYSNSTLFFQLFTFFVFFSIFLIILFFAVTYLLRTGAADDKYNKSFKFIRRSFAFGFATIICIIIAFFVLKDVHSQQSFYDSQSNDVMEMLTVRNDLIKMYADLIDYSIDYTIDADYRKIVNFNETCTNILNQIVSFIDDQKVFSDESLLLNFITTMLQSIKVSLIAINQRYYTVENSLLPSELGLRWDSSEDLAEFRYRVDLEEFSASPFTTMIDITLPALETPLREHSYADFDNDINDPNLRLISQTTVSDGRSKRLFDSTFNVMERYFSKVVDNHESHAVGLLSSLQRRNQISVILLVLSFCFFILFSRFALKVIKLVLSLSPKSSIQIVPMPILQRLSFFAKFTLVVLIVVIFGNAILITSINNRVVSLSASVGASSLRHSLFHQVYLSLYNIKQDNLEYEFSHFNLQNVVDEALTIHDLILNGRSFQRFSIDTGSNLDGMGHLLHDSNCLYTEESRCNSDRHGVSVNGILSLINWLTSQIELYYDTNELHSQILDVLAELLSGLGQATEIFKEGTLGRVNAVAVTGTIFNVVVIFVIILTYLFVFRPMTSTLLEEVRRTRGVLALIPEDLSHVFHSKFLRFLTEQ